MDRLTVEYNEFAESSGEERNDPCRALTERPYTKNKGRKPRKLT